MLTIIAFLMGFAATPRTPNACEVLSPRDIAKVQGARSTSAKLTEHDTHDMKVSQCFYALPHLSDSVTVSELFTYLQALTAGTTATVGSSYSTTTCRDSGT